MIKDDVRGVLKIFFKNTADENVDCFFNSHKFNKKLNIFSFLF